MGEVVAGCAANTDRELWRRVPDDFYSPSIHVTAGGGIGINVGGLVFVMPVEGWHRLAELKYAEMPTRLGDTITLKLGKPIPCV